MLKQKTPLRRKTPMARAGFARKPASDIKPAAGPKPRKCGVKGCRAPFQSSVAHQTWCSEECAVIIALARVAAKNAKAAKIERAADKIKKESMKGRRELLFEVQRVFNNFIRQRDDGLPCIDCGRTSVKDYLTGSAWHSGHYRSVGSAPHLRFNEDNVHRQLAQCNCDMSGRAVDYRIGLIARIGLARVEALESDNTPRKWTLDELREMKRHYSAKLRALKASI